MATTPPTITQFTGATPQRGDKTTFGARVDAFVTWFIGTFAELPALASNVYANAVEAFNSASTATTAATNALAAANASPWVSGTTYAVNACAISQVNFQAYRRRVAGAGTVDPSSDGANWVLVVGNATNGAFVPAAVSALNIDLSLGNFFTKSISANSTFTFSNVPAGGYSFTLELTTTAAVTAAFPSSVKTPSNAAATLLASKTSLLMFETSNGGARWRLVIAPNFDI